MEDILKDVSNKIEQFEVASLSRDEAEGLELIILTSIAISLKRIADILQKEHDGGKL